mmetsp:Transcript_21358/g.35742  ORF Transcript_21358/g.35742 Transcript_21358/m.35742 type:complete len:211 (-) Transcript_21358:552-1184(-)
MEEEGVEGEPVRASSPVPLLALLVLLLFFLALLLVLVLLIPVVVPVAIPVVFTPRRPLLPELLSESLWLLLLLMLPSMVTVLELRCLSLPKSSNNPRKALRSLIMASGTRELVRNCSCSMMATPNSLPLPSFTYLGDSTHNASNRFSAYPTTPALLNRFRGFNASLLLTLSTAVDTSTVAPEVTSADTLQRNIPPRIARDKLPAADRIIV